MLVPSELTTIDDAVPANVEDALAAYIETRRDGLAQRAPGFLAGIDALTAFVLGGGKRIRPTFAWWGWRGAGGEATGERASSVLAAISALEFLQACALIHDDIMDASATRRGAPTVHVAFADRHRTRGWHGDPDRFGTAAAILIGDLAMTWAEDMFASSGLTATMLAAGHEPWQAMRSEVLAGQFLDVLAQAEGDESTLTALAVARMKTAAYTVERPLHLGAALAGAEPHTVTAVRRFGADIGVAFQLRDDLLGMYGDTRATGKPAGDDLREGKRTLLVALGMQRAEEADAQPLREALGNPELTEETIERIRAMLIDVGAVAAVEQRIAALTSAATEALRDARLAEPAATRLAELAVAATTRDR
jgi:geranylgeranyl diphosphate synthase, type I